MATRAVSRQATVTDPEPRVDYTRALVDSTAGLTPGLLGLIGLLLGYAVVVPGLLYAFLGVGWLLERIDGEGFGAYYTRASRYHTVGGLVATHLALASLLIVVLVLARYVNHRAPRWVASVQPGIRWKFGLLVGLVAVVVLNLTQLLVRGGVDTHYTVPQHWWVWLLAIIITSPFQAIAEEMFFRGYLMNVISGLSVNLPEKARRWTSVVVSALIFALMHGTQNAWLFTDRFAFGLLAGWLVIVTGGIEAGVAAHVVNNLFAFGYAVFLGGVSQARGMTTMSWMDSAWDIGGFLTIALAGWWIGNLMRVARRTPA
ncbi:CPBP family intramembrane metalloprotease [Propionibacterium sp. NM47_B9-13]|jgi:membrane protease YdiL (CAAX protease family)|uniref:CAAX prenyl protease 2/Lysostaphin resistance protein A-like domain-containing protein n=2 Tax=Cutibacterium modestum TaxID=2559073 RepID=A0AAD1KNH5_9ACTN|nr:CPBP family intramembrane glutamic endopeptidase [Cutibacterium modestum]TGY27305.1 CPBP family intramembrane metalloprotease [Propionibacterium sp. NM47_B9-13]EFS75253.1 CAAX amino terminal protease family protein [Cutibacterium modestum HL037PA2]EFS91084.1 CAAX amino terminal protease family protein [Cutibacterium modestum HL044PA1]EFT16842.1 CAAX amino terminal protease family protein [Cutibacterium modestum HL037PA3]EGG27613.1 CAAX amino terminal protease family protein [Cutibacterium m